MRQILLITLFLFISSHSVFSYNEVLVVMNPDTQDSIGLTVKPLVIDESFTGKVELASRMPDSEIKERKLNWAIRKLDRWGKPSTIHQSSIPLFQGTKFSGRTLFLDLPERWERGDFLELSLVDDKGKEISNWTYPFLLPFEMNDKVLGPYKRIAREPLSLQEIDGDLILIAGTRKFVFDMRANYLREIWLDGEMIPFAQVSYSIEGLDLLKGKKYYDWNSNGSLTVYFEFTPSDSKVAWTVFADGRLKLETDLYISDNQIINKPGLGFDLNENKLKEIKWIGNGPKAESVLHSSKFGIWQSFLNENSNPDFSMGGGITSEADLYALRLKFERTDVIIRSETQGIFFELQNPIWGTSNSDLPITYSINSDLGLLINKDDFYQAYVPEAESSPSGEGSQQATQNEFKKGLTLWFDFKKAP
ncbi:hypothetical protein [Algoriphagus sediminis]|uniref:Uncharacterized protein n=1 Tax=Algoriphagus sediminis TaxID=3057113 RepID=A0ABT7YB23_9BACT|nr:hypothetical protein [Algoriphagus sediminis]MDN3203718.1 hypothetical protein [Algoriphagus sediminis]